MPVPDEYHHHPEGEQPTTVLLLPGFTVIDHVTPALVPDLIRHFVDSAPTTTTPLPDAQQATVEPQQQQQPGDREASSSPATEQVASEKPTSDISEQNSALELADLQKSLLPPTSLTPLRSRPCPHAAVILLCSQKTRDARCGQSAPLLRREFERHLRPLGLYRDLHDERPGGVGIYFISHVGGHKYSANVIVYRRRDFEWFKKKGDSALEDGENGGLATNEGAAQGIWLARVRPEDCESIVKFTVLQGKVVKPGLQLRGGFDREKGLISW